MHEDYLQDLISQATERGGGFILSSGSKPEIVVMTVERYNQLLQNSGARQVIGAVPGASQEPEDDFRCSGKKILVTGGAGYIGSHAARQLLSAGFQVAILDNLATGKRENVPAGAKFIEGDLGDANLLRDVFAQEQFFAVMHFAASLEVEESVREPEKYLRNNTLNTANLLAGMAEHNVKRIIFSSTAAVYGEQDAVPIPETAKLSPGNPYGYSKLLCERLIKYYCHFVGFKAVVFRFFNACGSDFDGKISSAHTSHLIPSILEVVEGTRPHILINGTDYQTLDGTCVRDYVHVLDIAHAHLLALEKIDGFEDYRIYNIGIGRGHSVREVVMSVSEVLNKIIPMEAGPRRPGDAPATVADSGKIRRELGFVPKFSDMETIIRTSWLERQNRRHPVEVELA